MDVLKFNLSGKTAFFKKPDVNSYYYFTYGCIHKIALMGILGAILGYKGYNQQVNENVFSYPEFYERLKNIKIGIVPKNTNGYISKKIQVYNNSVGYASKELGGNLVVKEQWLENPTWDVFILIQTEEEKQLSDRLINRRFKYIPYLGKNDHIANITNVEIMADVERLNTASKIDSIFIKRFFEIQAFEDDPFDPEPIHAPIYKYQEMLPIALEATTNKYELETFIYTNALLNIVEDAILYKCNEETIFFF